MSCLLLKDVPNLRISEYMKAFLWETRQGKEFTLVVPLGLVPQLDSSKSFNVLLSWSCSDDFNMMAWLPDCTFSFWPSQHWSHLLQQAWTSSQVEIHHITANSKRTRVISNPNPQNYQSNLIHGFEFTFTNSFVNVSFSWETNNTQETSRHRPSHGVPKSDRHQWTHFALHFWNWFKLLFRNVMCVVSSIDASVFSLLWRQTMSHGIGHWIVC